MSERLSYLALGSFVGFLIAQNKSPLDYIIIAIFVLLAGILSVIFKRRGEK